MAKPFAKQLSFFRLFISEVRLSYVGINMNAGIPSDSGPVLGNLTNNKTYIQKTEPNQTQEARWLSNAVGKEMTVNFGGCENCNNFLDHR